MKKKLVTGALLCAFGAVAITGGTLAYFTDTDTETNTFTVGSVEIEIVESQYHRDLDKVSAEQIKEDSKGSTNEYSKGYQLEYMKTATNRIVPGEWVRKAPYILNTGYNDAYVRVNLTLPKELDDHMEIMEYTTAQEKGAISEVTSKIDGADITYTWYYLNPLEPGELSYYAPFWQFRIAPEATNEDLSKFSDAVLNQLVVTAEAIQADGLLEADDADVDGDGDIDVYDAFALYDAQMDESDDSTEGDVDPEGDITNENIPS